MAGKSGFIGGLSNNFVIEQIVGYNLAGAVINAALTPYLNSLVQLLNYATPNVTLSPSEAAELVIRDLWSIDQGRKEALFSGLNNERFDRLVDMTGNAPAPGELAAALRRGFIDERTYEHGIRQGRLKNEWIDLPKKLAVFQHTPEAAMEAELEGQLDHGTALRKYTEAGGDPAEYEWQFNTRGSAPTPTQAADMANRGIIPWSGVGPAATSFEQAFLEGPWRNKWLAPFRAAAEYLPPPRTITALIHEGQLSKEAAAALFRKWGMSDELARVYVNAASTVKLAATRDLSMTTILEAYDDRLISRAQAKGHIEGMGYDGTEAETILAVRDARTEQRALAAAVSRIHALYVGRKIDHAATTDALSHLGVEPDDMSALLDVWDLERSATVKTLTEAQVVQSWYLKIMTEDEAIAALRGMGYTAHDAWVLLSIKNKGELPDEPPAPPTPPAAD